MRFGGVVAAMLGPILAIFLSHVFGAALGTRVALGRPLTRRERRAVFVEECRFLLVAVPPLAILMVLAIAGVSYTRIIGVIVLTGVLSIGVWGGVAGRRAGLTGWALVLPIAASPCAGEDGIIELHHRGVREHERRTHLTESGINMSDGSSTTKDTKSAGPSPLRLRVGVFLILLWIVPFWALAPYIAHSLSGLSNPPSVAAVTTSILVVQTIIGLFGFWVAGAAVKSIIKGSTMRHSLVAIWSMLIHGEVRGQGDVGNDPSEGDPNEGDPNEERPPHEEA